MNANKTIYDQRAQLEDHVCHASMAYQAGIEHARGVLHAEVLAMRDQQRHDFCGDRHKAIALLARLGTKLIQSQGVTGVQTLREELDITNKLLDCRNEVLDLIPACPEHGKQCMPHCADWITSKLG